MTDMLELQNIEYDEAYQLKKDIDDAFFCTKHEVKDKNKHSVRDDSWRYHRNRHYDHRYCDRWYVRHKGSFWGFSKQEKPYYRRLFRRSVLKKNPDMPIKGNYYKKTMWWDYY